MRLLHRFRTVCPRTNPSFCILAVPAEEHQPEKHLSGPLQRCHHLCAGCGSGRNSASRYGAAAKEDSIAATALRGGAVAIAKVSIPGLLWNIPISAYLNDLREQQDLRHTIEVMVDLGLTFVQVKSQEGHYVFQTEPDLDALSAFPGASETWMQSPLKAKLVSIYPQVTQVSRFPTSVDS